MQVLLPQTTTDQYNVAGAFQFPAAAQTGSPYVSGYLVIQPTSTASPTTGVFVSLLVGQDWGRAQWTEEIPIPPGVLPLGINLSSKGPRFIFGIRARNLVPGTNALVQGALYQPNDVAMIPQAGGGSGAPFSTGGGGGSKVLQVYGGIAPGADFTWSDISGAFHTTNFPTNTAFNKISGTSLLLAHLEGDFVAGANVPAIITMGISVDGANTQSVGHHVSFSGGFFSADLSRFIGVGNTGFPPLAAGAHTITTQVWLLSSAANTVTARTSTSWNLEMIELEP